MVSKLPITQRIAALLSQSARKSADTSVRNHFVAHFMLGSAVFWLLTKLCWK